MHSKVTSCLYLKVPKLTNLANQNREKSEIITISPNKKQLQQDLENKTEIKKNQITYKQIKTKFKPKQSVKTI